MLAMLFAAAALVLATVGVYGVNRLRGGAAAAGVWRPARARRLVRRNHAPGARRPRID